jgi:hypothetical protein
MNAETKVCPRCGLEKDREKDFYPKFSEGVNTKGAYCKECTNNYHKEHTTTYADNPDCSQYLGILIEHILADTLGATRAANGTIGYDFTCPKGYLIDSKASSKRRDGSYRFMIKHNTTADYFACVAVDRTTMTIKYLWYIPGDLVSHYQVLTIDPEKDSWKKYAPYLRPIDKIAVACEIRKKEAGA